MQPKVIECKSCGTFWRLNSRFCAPSCWDIKGIIKLWPKYKHCLYRWNNCNKTELYNAHFFLTVIGNPFWPLRSACIYILLGSRKKGLFCMCHSKGLDLYDFLNDFGRSIFYSPRLHFFRLKNRVQSVILLNIF